MALGVLFLEIHLPGCSSLKEKRGRLKPLLARLHKKFNVSVAEMDRLDAWGESVIACALISNDRAHTERSLQEVARWIEENWFDVTVVGEQYDLF
jgi:uncharacterized protein YlxP (DUF503 family)